MGMGLGGLGPSYGYGKFFSFLPNGTDMQVTEDHTVWVTEDTEDTADMEDMAEEAWVAWEWECH